MTMLDTHALSLVFLETRHQFMALLGLREGNEQCWSSQASTVLQSSSMLAVDTIVLYLSNSLSIISENWPDVKDISVMAFTYDPIVVMKQFFNSTM